jgi:hypothetical protein
MIVYNVKPLIVIANNIQECLTTAVSSTQCEASNIDCVCDSAVFLESLFECSIDQAEDEDGMFCVATHQLLDLVLTV